MRYKSLLYALLLCLVFITAAACSPAAGPDDDRQRYNALGGNHLYSNPAGTYDDDRGFKNDFQVSDLNPNLVTGTNDLYNVNADARIMRDVALGIRGVQDANVIINGGTAHVNIDVANGADVTGTKGAVYEQVKFKMPRYNVHVEVQ